LFVLNLKIQQIFELLRRNFTSLALEDNAIPKEQQKNVEHILITQERERNARHDRQMMMIAQKHEQCSKLFSSSLSTFLIQFMT
jgi:hypothetical protein